MSDPSKPSMALFFSFRLSYPNSASKKTLLLDDIISYLYAGPIKTEHMSRGGIPVLGINSSFIVDTVRVAWWTLHAGTSVNHLLVKVEVF